jgi:hypothetical protein
MSRGYERWLWRRNSDLSEWIALRGWSDRQRQMPALAAAAGWPRFRNGAGVVMAAEGTIAGRRAALARNCYEGGEGGECYETAVWAELRWAPPCQVVVIRRRLFERRVHRPALTGNAFFDRLFKVWPKKAVPDLPWGLVSAVPRLVPGPNAVVLASGSVQLTREGWLSPPDLERLLGEVVALAEAADDTPATHGPARAPDP